MSAGAFESIAPQLERVELAVRQMLVEPNLPTEDVYFLEGGLGSTVATSVDDESIEVGHIGWEGMSGTHILLGTDTTPTKTFLQVAGSGLRLPVSRIRELIERDASARELLLRYVHCSDLQLAHSALANARYSVHERLARWLLMCHDRLNSDDLALTHEFLALMLGVRRSGVTNEIHILEGLHVIKATRGNIRVINRPKLEEIAGGSYGTPEAEYDRLIGPAYRR